MLQAINMYEQLDETGDRSVDAYLALAKYADTQYQNIVNYMNSSTYEAKQSLMRKSQQEADRLREVMGESAKEYVKMISFQIYRLIFVYFEKIQIIAYKTEQYHLLSHKLWRRSVFKSVNKNNSALV
jgi:hypothetical protein